MIRPTYNGKYIAPVIILKVVSDVMLIPVSQILRKDKVPLARKREIIAARHLGMYFECLYTRNSLSCIASHYGRISHATVFHAVKVIKGYIDVKDPVVYQRYIDINRKLNIIYIKESNKYSKRYNGRRRTIKIKMMIANRVPLHIRENILQKQYT